MPGDDIDTDQIIESRYLKLVSFEGIEAHLFESRRQPASRTTQLLHPLDDPRFAGASVLVVNRNFGCGSSREHAPQAIRRFGIRAIVGESFGEIFAGNAVSIGLPCFTVPADELAWLQEQCTVEPQAEIDIDIRSCVVDAFGRRLHLELPEGRRRRLLDGSWNSLDVLLSRKPQVDAYLNALP